MFPAETPILSGFFATQTTVFHYAKTQMGAVKSYAQIRLQSLAE